MSTLDAAGLLSSELPPAAGPAVALLARLEGLVKEQKAGVAQAELQRQARALYAELLVALAAVRQDDTAPSLGPPEELRTRFLDSVLLWQRFCETSSLEPLIDSLGTRSIRAFPIDLPPDAAAAERLQAALAQSLQLTPLELDDARRRVDFLCSALTLKRALSAALAERLRAAGTRHEELLALFHECYGALPLRPGDVDFVLTSTAVFFVLPLGHERLDVANWDARPEAERAQISGFLTRLERANLSETWRFPAFGLFDAEQVSDALLQQLAQATATPPELVRKTLSTMVSILSRSDIDQYLVHDAWGHTWQEVLNEFELDYALLRKTSEPLSPAAGPVFGGPDTPTLASAFRFEHGQCVLDEARLLASAEADLRGRIQVGTSQALSEVLADFVEAKYSRLNREQPLPTSSLLGSDNLKLDLTLQDVLRQARRWSRPYRDFWSKTEERARWVRELGAGGLPEQGLAAAVERAAHLLEMTWAQVLRPLVAVPDPAQPAGTPPTSTVATRILLESALLCAELERVLEQTANRRAVPAWLRPTYCPDLWAVSLTHLYEADRQQRFWCLDTLVRHVLRQACDDLGQALEQPVSPQPFPARP